MQTRLLAKEAALALVSSNAAEVAAHHGEMVGARRTIARLRHQLGTLAQASGQRINELQTQLQRDATMRAQVWLAVCVHVGCSWLPTEACMVCVCVCVQWFTRLTH